MKFINYLESTMGVSIYGLASFMLFFTFFVFMAIWVFKADKKLITHLSEIPFDHADSKS
jgi:hypothetical protein